MARETHSFSCTAKQFIQCIHKLWQKQTKRKKKEKKRIDNNPQYLHDSHDWLQYEYFIYCTICICNSRQQHQQHQQHLIFLKMIFNNRRQQIHSFLLPALPFSALHYPALLHTKVLMCFSIEFVDVSLK